MSSGPAKDLDHAAPLDGDERVHVNDDPTGTPESKYATIDDILTYLKAFFLLLDTSNDPLTGALQIQTSVLQSLFVDNTSGDTAVEIGALSSGDRNIYLDLTGDDTYTTYGLRLQRSAGANSQSRIRHRGTGNLRLESQDGANISLEGGDVGVGTVSPGVKLDVDGDIQVRNQNELRFADNGNYVGFEAPALSANQIWVLPNEDAPNPGDVLASDAAGNLGWLPFANTEIIDTGFASPSGNVGTFYERGHYDFATSSSNFSSSVSFRTTNASYADHIFLVAAAGGGGGTDTVIRITGTSITDPGVRTTSDTEDITLDNAGAAGAYYETTKRWIGQISISHVSGPLISCNYGGAKYFTYAGRDFTVKAVDATWRGGANDNSPDILLLHHKKDGWTYNAGSAPTPPPAITSMQGTHVTEIRTRNGEEHAWRVTELDTFVEGSNGEGLIIQLDTNNNSTFDAGSNMSILVEQDLSF